MITVSEQAKSALWASLQQSGIPTDQGLRLQAGSEGFTLEIDIPTEDDRVIRHQNSPVIIIDGALDEQIDDLLIDITDSSQGPQLTIQAVAEPRLRASIAISPNWGDHFCDVAPGHSLMG